jgi:hypothetical protein
MIGKDVLKLGLNNIVEICDTGGKLFFCALGPSDALPTLG